MKNHKIKIIYSCFSILSAGIMICPLEQIARVRSLSGDPQDIEISPGDTASDIITKCDGNPHLDSLVRKDETTRIPPDELITHAEYTLVRRPIDLEGLLEKGTITVEPDPDNDRKYIVRCNMNQYKIWTREGHEPGENFLESKHHIQHIHILVKETRDIVQLDVQLEPWLKTETWKNVLFIIAYADLVLNIPQKDKDLPMTLMVDLLQAIKGRDKVCRAAWLGVKMSFKDLRHFVDCAHKSDLIDKEGRDYGMSLLCQVGPEAG